MKAFERIEDGVERENGKERIWKTTRKNSKGKWKTI